MQGEMKIPKFYLHSGQKNQKKEDLDGKTRNKKAFAKDC